MSRRGFTLLELLVAVAVAGLGLSLLLGSWFDGWRRGATVDHRLRCLQAACLVRARLADDLAAYVPGAPAAAATTGVSSLTLLRVPVGAGSGPGGTNLDGRLGVAAVPVTWSYDGAAQRLLRNGRSVVEAPFAAVSFSHEPCSLRSGRGERVGVRLEFAPSAPRPAGAPRPAVFEFSFHCLQATLARSYDDWRVYAW